MKGPGHGMVDRMRRYNGEEEEQLQQRCCHGESGMEEVTRRTRRWRWVVGGISLLVCSLVVVLPSVSHPAALPAFDVLLPNYRRSGGELVLTI